MIFGDENNDKTTWSNAMMMRNSLLISISTFKLHNLFSCFNFRELCIIISELYDVGHLLKADNCSLRSVLLSKYVEINNESLVSDLSSVEAENIRDSLCRTLYSRLFTYVVTRINESIKVRENKNENLMWVRTLFVLTATSWLLAISIFNIY